MLKKSGRLTFAVMLLVMLLVPPVEHVAHAAETGSYVGYVPYLQGIGVELERNDTNFVGWITGQISKQRSISNIVFQFDKLSAVDYTKYELVIDFELRSLLEDGTVKTYPYEYVGELGEKNSPGFLDSILISLSLEDNYFVQSFNYLGVIKNSPDFAQAASDSSLATSMGKNAYNTVITQADCYLREKSGGNYGLISRFVFTWDADFWNQLCTGIVYRLVVPGTDEVLQSEEHQNMLFTDGVSSDGTNWWQDMQSLLSKFGVFIVSLPSMIYEVVSGVFRIYGELVLLCKAVFPFIPGLLFDIFGVVILLGIMLGVWYFVKGD